MSPELTVVLSHQSELLLSSISQGTRLCNYQPVAGWSHSLTSLGLIFFF